MLDSTLDQVLSNQHWKCRTVIFSPAAPSNLGHEIGQPRATRGCPMSGPTPASSAGSVADFARGLRLLYLINRDDLGREFIESGALEPRCRSDNFNGVSQVSGRQLTTPSFSPVRATEEFVKEGQWQCSIGIAVTSRVLPRSRNHTGTLRRSDAFSKRNAATTSSSIALSWRGSGRQSARQWAMQLRSGSGAEPEMDNRPRA